MFSNSFAVSLLCPCPCIIASKACILGTSNSDTIVQYRSAQTSVMTRILPSAAQTLAPHAPKPSRPAINPVMSSTRPHYERVRDYILRAADQMHEADYAFRPVPEVRSFGELLGHIASTQFSFCATALKE